MGGLNPKKVEDRLKDNFKETGLTFSPDGPGKQRANKIPAVPADLQKRINEIVK